MNALRRRATAVLGAVVLSLAPYAAGAQQGEPISPDLLVVGATPAGIAAALTAARDGESVILTSATGDLGGTLTDAMMDQWDLNVRPDGTPLQGGIFAEIHARLGDVFTPPVAERTFAGMLAAQRRVRVLYDEVPVSSTASVVGAERRVDDVTFRNALTGKFTSLQAPAIIDATDAGDVAALAGARYDVGRQDTGIDEREQAVTEMFTVAGVDWATLGASYDPARFGYGGVVGNRAWGYSRLLARYRPGAGNIVVRDLNLGLRPDGSVSVNAVDVCGIEGLDPRELKIAKRQTEREAPRLLNFLRARVPGFADARVGSFAPEVYVRETRHFAGLERLTTQDILAGRIPADSIGLASYPIDLHPVDPSDEPAFATRRHMYGIPFGALIPSGFTNMLLAGPAICASHVASGSARTIPTTIEEGEADGVASVLARASGLNFIEFAAQPRRLMMLSRLALRDNEIATGGVAVRTDHS
ncbi:MAG: FAD-dependent oxidoreductase [Candidatus Eremiobacteraeota bacterium]|nr:FAD-dependent oxidoreductase [Candidatus Eremiobacteraeota bacterium]MBC5821795.1 FAD-dependent oxidoreductase [Candidatus Eremiobacteraeota bacterium]